jgi:hypothetical protein
LSVEPFQAIEIVVSPVPVTLRFWGTEGACVSGQSAVVIMTGVGAEWFPAPS